MLLPVHDELFCVKLLLAVERLAMHVSVLLSLDENLSEPTKFIQKRDQVQPQIRDTMGCPSWSLLDFVICHLRATIRLAISNGYLYFLICLWTWNGHYLGIGHASTFSESCRKGMLFKMDRLQKNCTSIGQDLAMEE